MRELDWPTDDDVDEDNLALEQPDPARAYEAEPRSVNDERMPAARMLDVGALDDSSRT